MKKLIAEFIETSELVQCTQINGLERKSYKVNLNDFRQSLAVGNVGTEWSAPLGELPKGYVNARLGANSATGLTADVIIRHQAETRLVTLCGKNYCIPMPELVFHLTFKGGKLVGDAVFACKPGTDELCHYPFSNVYSDGHICWGSNILPTVKTLKDTEDVVELFLRSNNNNDLVQGYILNAFKSSSLEGVFTKLEESGVFPLSGYINNGMTVENLFNN